MKKITNLTSKKITLVNKVVIPAYGTKIVNVGKNKNLITQINNLVKKRSISVKDI